MKKFLTSALITLSTFCLGAKAEFFAIQFDGSTGYGEVLDNPSLQFGTGNFTIEITFSAISFPTAYEPSLLVKASGINSVNYNIQIIGIPIRHIHLGMRGSASATYYYVESTTTVSTNTTYHIAGVKEGTTLKLYIDGVLNNTGFTDPGAVNPINPLRIGTNLDVGVPAYFNGKIDEVRLWNVARTATEIQGNFDNELFGNEPNLVAYYKYNEGAGNTFTDSSPNNNNGTLIGGYSWISGLIQQGPMEISMVPQNPPIIIPSGGSSFNFTISVENNTAQLQTTDIWTEILLPEVGSVPVLMVMNYNIPANGTVSRLRTQIVPASAPAGVYTYFGYIGDYPWVVAQYDSFTFEKAGTDRGILGSSADWVCSGELFDGEALIASPILSSFKLNPPSPNPFNASTTITFNLPTASEIELKIFDISGREVAALGTGHWALGEHSVVWDAEGLPSGIYFARLTAGDFNQTQKLLLLK
jgi:hypothetical protein